MVKQFYYLCCAAVLLSPLIVPASAAEPSRNAGAEERGSIESPVVGVGKAAEPKSAARDAKLESWSTRIAKFLSLSPLGYRIFPLALLVQGDRFIHGPNRSQLPAELIRARFSRQFVRQYFQRAVEREDVVDDVILGTKIDGQSHLSGTVRIVLLPSNDDIRFDLIFSGVCRSQTQGVNDIVILQNTAETHFNARKQFVWNANGLATSPAVATAETHSTTGRIDSTLPGVIGRVATRIAQDRVAESRPQADAISSQHSAARIQRGLDARVDRSLAWARFISHHLLASSFLGRATRIELRSTSECVQIVVMRRDVPARAAPRKLPTLPANTDVAVRIHRGLLKSFIRDPLTLLIGGTVADQIVVTERRTGAVQLDASAGSRQPAWQIVRSSDNQWLFVRHIRPAPMAEPAPAAWSTPVVALPAALKAPANP